MFAKMNFLVVHLDIRTREVNVAGWMNLFYWQALLCASLGFRFLGADSVRFWEFCDRDSVGPHLVGEGFLYISFFFLQPYV
jgi:hypothetical protein